jgi:hypothetical protein
MFFAIPIVGKILAGLAATEASADSSATQAATQLKTQASRGGIIDPSAFAQTLNAVDQAAASGPQRAAPGAAKA